MDLNMMLGLKYIGAGIATVGMGLAGIGGGIVLGGLIIGLTRNPSVKAEIFPLALISFALVESTVLFCLMISFLLLFAI